MSDVSATERARDKAVRHAKTAMADLEAETGDTQSAYSTSGLTNWIPTLARDVLALASALEDAKRENEWHKATKQALIDAHTEAVRTAARYQEQYHAETLISNEYAARTRIAWELLDDALAVENTSMEWRERANRERPRGVAPANTKEPSDA